MGRASGGGRGANAERLSERKCAVSTEFQSMHQTWRPQLTALPTRTLLQEAGEVEQVCGAAGPHKATCLLLQV